MHLLVTDVLACPRCGPQQGLILLADRVADRRVREGRLGCANCRSSYPIRSGTVELDPISGEVEPDPHPAFEGDPDEVAVRVAALLGLSDAPSLILLAGIDLRVARSIAKQVEQTEVILQRRAASSGAEGGSGVSRVRAATDSPLRHRSVHGVALPFSASRERIRAAAAMVAPGGRLVACTDAESIVEELESSGMATLLYEEGVLVMERPSGPARRLHQVS